MKNRIIITIKGGLVASVYVDPGLDPNNNQEVVVLDYDCFHPEDDFDFENEEEMLAEEDIKSGKVKKIY